MTVARGRGSSKLGERIGGDLLALSTRGHAAVLFLGCECLMALGALRVLCAAVDAAVGGIFLLSDSTSRRRAHSVSPG